MYLDIYEIKPTLFMNLIKKSGHKIFIASIINIKKILKPKQHMNLVKKVSKKYHKYLDIFS